MCVLHPGWSYNVQDESLKLYEVSCTGTSGLVTRARMCVCVCVCVCVCKAECAPL